MKQIYKIYEDILKDGVPTYMGSRWASTPNEAMREYTKKQFEREDKPCAVGFDVMIIGKEDCIPSFINWLEG